MINVPFADLYAQYLTIKPEIDEAIADVIASSSFIRGKYVDKFEEDFSRIMKASNCVSCGNGTDSLYIAMHALDLQSGDEVIAPAHSWISTAETITQAGGTVIFCDTDTNNFTIDPQCIESKITPRTVGIIPVHLYGHPCDMDAIMSIAKKHNLWVLEDCAQAHLARYKSQLVGSFGNAASFSFYPGKNLGAMGDAGAIITPNKDLYLKMAMYSRHGGLIKGEHTIEGINSRLDGIQAAVLSVKIPYLLEWTKKRQKIAHKYIELLGDVEDIYLPLTAHHCEHVYHLFVIRHPKRDQLASHLLKNGIQTSINYKTALPFLSAYSRFHHVPDDFPNAYFNQSRILSLPIYPEMTEAQIEYVVSTIKSFNCPK